MRAAWFALSLLVLMSAPGLARAQSERSALCGYVYAVEGYRAYLPGVRIELPANDRLIVNGRVLAEINPWVLGETPAPWRDSANTAQIAVADTHILIVTRATDCLDYDLARVYVLSRRGVLLGSMDMAGAERFSFNIERTGEIVYRGGENCADGAGPAPDRAYVQVLRPDRHAFVRQERARADVCEPNAETRANALYFAPMQPLLPR